MVVYEGYVRKKNWIKIRKLLNCSKPILVKNGKNLVHVVLKNPSNVDEYTEYYKKLQIVERYMTDIIKMGNKYIDKKYVNIKLKDRISL